MKDLIKLDGMCLWEDCDQEAIYCAGHALEFANVSNENEAILLRHKVRDLMRVLNRIATESTDAHAAHAARSALAQYGEDTRRHQWVGLDV